MTFDLGDRLQDLATAVERGELPVVDLEALERALARVERDRWVRVAAEHAGGCSGLLEVLAAERWRLDVWHARGRCPPHAGPILTALFNATEAAPLPASAKQLRRIVQGHDMSQIPVKTGS